MNLMAAHLSKQPPNHRWRPSFPVSIPGDGRFIDRIHSTTTRTCCVRIKGRPWWIKGPKQAIPAKRGLQRYLCTVRGCGFIQVLGSLLNWLAHFSSTQKVGQKNTGRCFTTSSSSQELFGSLGSFTGNFCLRTYGHTTPPFWKTWGFLFVFFFRTCFWWSLEVFIRGVVWFPSWIETAWPVGPHKAKKRKKDWHKGLPTNGTTKTQQQTICYVFFFVPFCFFR